ncbi:chorismate mutase AroQ, gamma subclass [Enterobacterales bacterium CwR94]|nr:chorismate mutase AroQ, gamma subclass [Enterobacterales bacterium CwR94]
MRTLSLTLALCLSFAVQASDITPLTSLINQRLGWMQDVAGEKFQQNLAVEDLAQEARVLQATANKAATLGLDGESVKPFIQAQMDAAKRIQRHYIAEWKTQLPAGWQPRPLSEVRAAIAQQSDAILAQLANQLKAGQTITDADRAQFAQQLSERPLSASDINSLFDALMQVRLSAS